MADQRMGIFGFVGYRCCFVRNEFMCQAELCDNEINGWIIEKQVADNEQDQVVNAVQLPDVNLFMIKDNASFFSLRVKWFRIENCPEDAECRP